MRMGRGTSTHLEVVLVDLHLQVKPCELTHVPVRVRVLGAEDRADLKHSSEVRADSHLLVQLRGHR